jgi:hypothetical protein
MPCRSIQAANWRGEGSMCGEGLLSSDLSATWSTSKYAAPARTHTTTSVGGGGWVSQTEPKWARTSEDGLMRHRRRDEEPRAVDDLEGVRPIGDARPHPLSSDQCLHHLLSLPRPNWPSANKILIDKKKCFSLYFLLGGGVAVQ